MTITSISPVNLDTGIVVATAPYAPAGPILAGTSGSTVNIGSNPLSFLMNEFGLGFVPGVRVRCSYQTNPIDYWVEGIVTEFDVVGNVLTVEVDTTEGSGNAVTGWNINVAGVPGQTAAAGPPGPPGPPGGVIQGVLQPFSIDGSNNLVLNYDATLHVSSGQLGIPSSVILPGAPSASATPAPGDNTTKLATTAFVEAALTVGASQPLDADLTAISALTGTNTIYYRSAVDTWSPVVMGTNMSFSGGVLSAAGGGSGGGFITGVNPPFTAPAGVLTLAYITSLLSVDVSGNLTIAASAVFPGTPAVATPPAPSDNTANIATTAWVRTFSASFAPLASPIFSGNPTAPTPATADSSTSLATTAFVKAQGPFLQANVTANLTAGYTATSTNGGTITGNNQTYTPTPGSAVQNLQNITLNGASLTGNFTFAPPASECTAIVDVINGGTGAVGATLVTSGYTKVTGDAWAATAGNVYRFFASRIGTRSLLQIAAMQ
jgi:hypothetical protein